MYTYIITAIVGLIALGCIFGKKEKTGATYFSALIIFVILTFVTSLTVNIIRRNSLSLKTEINDIYTSVPFNVKKTMTYSVTDTLDDGKTVVVKKFDKFPLGFAKVEKHINETFKNAMFAGDTAIMMQYKKSDSDLDTIIFGFDSPYYVSTETHAIEYGEYRVGDKWSEGWSFPCENSHFALFLSIDDINYLKSVNSNLFAKWKQGSL